jgi:hypothetical protein
MTTSSRLASPQRPRSTAPRSPARCASCRLLFHVCSVSYRGCRALISPCAQYTTLGGNGKGVSNCAAWAQLFIPNATNNEPGVPPSQGTDSLTALCNRRAHRWQTFLPSVQVEIPVMSWNTNKRLVRADHRLSCRVLT